MAIENEVVIIAEVVALPGKREELRRAIVEDFVPKSLAEEGVSVFRLHENRDTPGHFVLYERFRDQAAIDSLFAQEHFARFKQTLASLAEGGEPKRTYLRALTE